MPTSIFDVAGPIMIGPSSSHTAGACKIGQLARAVFQGRPDKVTFYLHGSFATVYQGHATDRALLAGVMKCMTSDPRIPEAFKMAEEQKLAYKFLPTHLGAEHHPNTVKIVLEKKGRKKQSVIGSSLGGGKVKLTHINDIPIDFEASVGRFFSLLIGHDNKPEVLNPLYGKLIDWGCPISEKQTHTGGENSLTFLNIEDHFLKLPQVLELEKLPGIHFARALTRLLKY